MSIEQQLQAALAEIERLKAEVHARAVTNARYPWENPELVQGQPRMAYNFKIEPELYLQIKWILENKGGMKSIQVFLDKAANKLAGEILRELGTVG